MKTHFVSVAVIALSVAACTVDSVVGGKRDKVYGTACRQADGSWRVQQ